MNILLFHKEIIFFTQRDTKIYNNNNNNNNHNNNNNGFT
jgi:hypothetical protein